MISNKRKILTIEFTVIILLWTLIFTSPLFFMNEYNDNLRSVHVLWVEWSVIGFAFVINRFILMPHLFFRKKYTEYALSLSALLGLLSIFIINYDGVDFILSFFGSEHEPFHQLMDWDSPPPPPGAPMQPSFIPPYVSVLVFMVLTLALDMGLSIAIKWLISEQEQAFLSKQAVDNELNSLKNQVSPHFFMNTLNNIHALVELEPKRAQTTIIELSSLMDYLLYESSTQEKVSLKKELEFTQNYVNLMRLRYPEKVVIEFNIDKDMPDVKLPALLFLNFIENTFKYGIDYSKESFIKIHFSHYDNFVEMSAINSNHSKSVKHKNHSGLGIQNAEQRLRLLYSNNFVLDIDNNPEFFSVTLKVPIP
ncbi:MAG: histidine kinase [Rikenellaceae bacterium]